MTPAAIIICQNTDLDNPRQKILRAGPLYL